MELTTEQLIKHYKSCIDSKINLIYYYEGSDIKEKLKIIRVLEGEIMNMQRKLNELEKGKI
ncbi:hypothetical protein [Cytobacillus praedii]|uniref:hypothetical protein n=1 Tax=Cytobacillus praedii TaxID=1742358 RepID=UPI002E1F81EB|nr:hypothetical protein [Cytobacillus praedii]